MALARCIGADLGGFDFVAVTSAPRTMETAIAMRFAVDTVLEFACGYIPGVFDRHAQWQWSEPYVRLAELVRSDGKHAAVAAADAALWRKLTSDLPSGGER